MAKGGKRDEPLTAGQAEMVPYLIMAAQLGFIQTPRKNVIELTEAGKRMLAMLEVCDPRKRIAASRKRRG